jgi:glycosyltransferase involved in cell wall biosynthesis
MNFSLVIPCYNEAANLPLLLSRCRSLSRYSNIDIVLVDNGSTDDSPAVLAELLPNHPNCSSIRVEINQGYGYGILAGLSVAKGEVLGWSHADMQTDLHDVVAGLDFFQNKHQKIFVKGHRYGRPLMDRLFTVAMSIFETLLLAKPMRDINAQPTMFKREFFETWVSPPHDFALDLYVYYQARLQKLAVHRFPVRFGPRAHGVSHWNINWASKRKFIQRTFNFSVELKRSLIK